MPNTRRERLRFLVSFPQGRNGALGAIRKVLTSQPHAPRGAPDYEKALTRGQHLAMCELMAGAHPFRFVLAALLYAGAALSAHALELGESKTRMFARHGEPGAEDRGKG